MPVVAWEMFLLQMWSIRVPFFVVGVDSIWLKFVITAWRGQFLGASFRLTLKSPINRVGLLLGIRHRSFWSSVKKCCRGSFGGL